MKIFSLFALLFPLFLSGDFFSAELRVGDFCPTSKKIRRIYNDHHLDLEVEASLKYCQNSALWANVNYVRQNGHSIGLKNETTLKLYPVSVGYKTFYGLGSSFLAYFGLGVSYTQVKIRDRPSEQIKGKIEKKAWGTVAKGGAIYYICSNIFADLFCDYYYTEVELNDHKNNIGGIRAGLGLGVNF